MEKKNNEIEDLKKLLDETKRKILSSKQERNNLSNLVNNLKKVLATGQNNLTC